MDDEELAKVKWPQRVVRGVTLDRPGRSDAYEAILKRYVQQESYHDRLAILLAKGVATRERAGFQLTRKGCHLAATVHAVQRFFGIERSG